jgi:hypothetical protein
VGGGVLGHASTTNSSSKAMTGGGLRRHTTSQSVVAPIVRHDGPVASVIIVRGPIERVRDEVEACAGHLLVVTSVLSAKLGHRA